MGSGRGGKAKSGRANNGSARESLTASFSFFFFLFLFFLYFFFFFLRESFFMTPCRAVCRLGLRYCVTSLMTLNIALGATLPSTVSLFYSSITLIKIKKKNAAMILHCPHEAWFQFSACRSDRNSEWESLHSPKPKSTNPRNSQVAHRLLIFKQFNDRRIAKRPNLQSRPSAWKREIVATCTWLLCLPPTVEKSRTLSICCCNNGPRTIEWLLYTDALGISFLGREIMLSISPIRARPSSRLKAVQQSDANISVQNHHL